MTKIIALIRVNWPDYLAALSNVIFTLALWPSVVANNPPEPATSAWTIVALLMLTASFIHFKMWWGTLGQLTCASLWAVLLIQGLS